MVLAETQRENRALQNRMQWSVDLRDAPEIAVRYGLAKNAQGSGGHTANRSLDLDLGTSVVF